MYKHEAYSLGMETSFDNGRDPFLLLVCVFANYFKYCILCALYLVCSPSADGIGLKTSDGNREETYY